VCSSDLVRAERARTIAGARQEAARIVADENADFVTYEVTVDGHGQMVGGQMTLYQPNTIAQVTDTLADLDRDPWLVTRVRFLGSRTGGKLTKLRMVPRGALVLTPGSDA
jgi:prophage tail gpP-like protein